MSGKRVIELRDVADLSCRKSVRAGSRPGTAAPCARASCATFGGRLLGRRGRVRLSDRPRRGAGRVPCWKTLYADVQLLVGEGCVVGFDLRKLRRRQIPYLRRKIGIVFQDYQLLTDRNVFQNLYYVMRATGWRAEAEIRRTVNDEVLQLVGLEAKHYEIPVRTFGRRAATPGDRPRPAQQAPPAAGRRTDGKPRSRDGRRDHAVVPHDRPEGVLLVVMSTHNTNLIEEYPARTLRFTKKGASRRSTCRRFWGGFDPAKSPPILSGGLQVSQKNRIFVR